MCKLDIKNDYMEEILLENIQRVLVYLRNNISSCNGLQLLCCILHVLINKKENKVFVKEIKQTSEYKKMKKQLGKSFLIAKGNAKVAVGNGNELLNLFLILIKEACSSIENLNLPKAYDIIDIVHVIPEMLLAYDERMVENYKKVYLIPFSLKWGEISITHDEV